MFRILIRFLIEAAVDTVGYNDSFSSVQLQVRSYLPNVHNLLRISEKKSDTEVLERRTWNISLFLLAFVVVKEIGTAIGLFMAQKISASVACNDVKAVVLIHCQIATLPVFLFSFAWSKLLPSLLLLLLN